MKAEFEKAIDYIKKGLMGDRTIELLNLCCPPMADCRLKLQKAWQEEWSRLARARSLKAKTKLPHSTRPRLITSDRKANVEEYVDEYRSWAGENGRVRLWKQGGYKLAMQEASEACQRQEDESAFAGDSFLCLCKGTRTQRFRCKVMRLKPASKE